MPLLCRVVEGCIEIRIGAGALAFAAKYHPYFWDPDSDPPNIKITDISTFAAEVADAINAEDEQGNTMLTRMLDSAIENAVEAGCEGVDHDA